MAWSISGDYFENCNCEILCPCITSYMQAPADGERCVVPIICRIDDGQFEGVRLDGLAFAIVADSPAVMAEGNWRVALYIDERADEGQRVALLAILSGDHGGVPGMLAGLIGEHLGVRFVPFTYEAMGHRRHAVIPGIMDVEVETITAPDNGEPVTITGVRHPMGSDLPVAKSLKGVFNDPEFGLVFDNTGKNGHVRAFAWAA